MSEDHDKKVLAELVFIRNLLLFMATLFGLLVGYVLLEAMGPAWDGAVP